MALGWFKIGLNFFVGNIIPLQKTVNPFKIIDFIEQKKTVKCHLFRLR